MSDLNKNLTLTDLFLMGIGNVVGASIFVILSRIIFYGGKNTYWSILLMGILSMVIYFCYLEIKNRYDTKINEYYAIKENLGNGLGHFSLYLIYFISVFSVVTIIIAMSKYLIKYMIKTHDSEKYHIGLSILLLLLMSIINYFGISTSKIFTNWIGGILLFLLILIIILYIPNTWTLMREEIQKKKKIYPKQNSFLLATILSLFLYNGYDSLIKMKEEAINKEDTYHSMWMTIMISILIYLFIVWIGIYQFGDQKSGTTYHLVVDLYEKLFEGHYGKGSIFSYLFGLFVMLNTALITLIACSRFLYHCSKHHEVIMSSWIDQVNQYHSPSISIFITFILIFVLLFMNNEVASAIFANFGIFILLSMICSSVLIMRWKERAEPKEEKNVIVGNINNIPIVLIITLGVLFYFIYSLCKSGFYMKEVHHFSF